jgi:hypothetical protein
LIAVILFYASLIWYIAGIVLILNGYQEQRRNVTVGNLLFIVTLGGCLGVIFWTVEYWNTPVIKWRNE